MSASQKATQNTQASLGMVPNGQEHDFVPYIRQSSAKKVEVRRQE